MKKNIYEISEGLFKANRRLSLICLFLLGIIAFETWLLYLLFNKNTQAYVIETGGRAFTVNEVLYSNRTDIELRAYTDQAVNLMYGYDWHDFLPQDETQNQTNKLELASQMMTDQLANEFEMSFKTKKRGEKSIGERFIAHKWDLIVDILETSVLKRENGKYYVYVKFTNYIKDKFYKEKPIFQMVFTLQKTNRRGGVNLGEAGLQIINFQTYNEYLSKSE